MDTKEIEFARKESEGSRSMPTKWLEWYIYSDNHEIFFANFPIALYEWLCNLANRQKNFQGGEPKDWSPFLIERLKIIKNPI